MPMMDHIHDLAALLESRYDAAGRRRSRFPDLAGDCLAESALQERLSISDVLAWLGRASDIGRQYDLANNFGDPPLTLWSNDEFRIEVYFWLETQTTIHDHRFSGAFQVLVGRTLHSTFAYHLDEMASDVLSFGELRCLATELMPTGAVRPIYGGPRMIHQALHLATPTVSLVVRSHLEYELLYQWRYWRPYLATVTTAQDGALLKRLAMLEFLAKTHLEQADDFVDDLLDSDDPYQVFHTLKAYYELFRDRERLADRLDTVRRRHGSWADRLAPVLGDTEITGEVRWSAMRDEGQRLLAGLITNCASRRSIDPLVSQFAPDRPASDSIVDWLDGLIEAGALHLALDSGAVERLPQVIRAGSASADRDSDTRRLRECRLLDPLLTAE